MELAGKIAIVTGAGSGLRRALAVGLANAGSGVVIADLDAVTAEETADLVRSCGVPAQALAADVRDVDEAHRLVRLARDLGGPHILVNNAGGWTPNYQYPQASPPEWGATLDLNLRAPMLLSQLALGPMKGLGGGAVVNIASSGGVGFAGYGSPEYAAAKAGLIRFTASLASLDESHGVRMTCIVPDWIGLDRALAQLADLPPADRAATPPLIPPADIVAVAVDLIRHGHSGAVVELWGGEPPRLRERTQR